MHPEVRDIFGEVRELDAELMDKAQARLDNLTKPQGSLGRLEELARHVAGASRKWPPDVSRKSIVVMAGDHGVAVEGVSAFPQEVTAQMVCNFLRGGAGINVLAEAVGARVTVVDMGVAADLGEHPGLLSKKIAPGTGNIAAGPAMSREQALECLRAGAEVIGSLADDGLDLVGIGDMGIANTTPSSAITAVITGREPAEVTGRGTGIDEATFAAKVRVIERAIEVNKPDPDDALDVLAKVGGFEIGGLAGVVLAAAARGVPVVIDGFISTAAALLAAGLEPRARDYMIAAHRSVEQGHRAALEKLGLRPLLDLELRLGEGTGGALAMGLVEAGVRIINRMATFGEAGVAGKSE